MNREDREQAERVLDRVPLAEWLDFLDADEGQHLKKRLDLVRNGLKESGLLAAGPPRKPTSELLDLMGTRILSDKDVGHWIRMFVARYCSASAWDELRIAHRQYAPRSSAPLHGNLTQAGQGPGVIAESWRQGGPWAREFCRITGLPEVLAASRTNPDPDDEDVIPAEPLPPLHPFQEEVYRKLRALIDRGPSSAGLLSLPTGAGKTRVTVEAICDHLAESLGNGGRRNIVLWISQGQELQLQAWECFRQVWQVPPRKTGKARTIQRPMPCRLVRLWGGRDPTSIDIGDEPTILIAGIDQLASWARTRVEWYAMLPIRRFACVVVDEAHSLITQEHARVLTELGLKNRHRWKRPADSVPIIGLTATPWRTNAEELDRLRTYFSRALIKPPSLGDKPVSVMQKQGFLSRVENSTFMVDGTPPMTAAQKKAFNTFKDLPGDYIKELGRLDLRNGRILTELAAQPKHIKAIVFACSIEHAEALAISLNRLLGGGAAAAVTSLTPRAERAMIIHRFKENDGLRFLVNVGVLSMGFDAPKVNAIFVTRPTTSALKYEQMVGRGLRGPRNGGTKSCLVVDFQDVGLPDGIQSYGRVAELWRK